MDSPNTCTFPSFICLPPELRLRIWELLLPPHRDLKIGPKTFERRIAELGEVWTNEPPLTLLSTCRESRRVALCNGCFTSNPTEDPGDANWVWIDRYPRTVYLPPNPASYWRACSLPINVRALACLWPKVEDMRRLKQPLLDGPAAAPIQVLYVALSGIIYDDTVSGLDFPVIKDIQNELRPPNPLYEGSDILVMGLDDIRLPALLECADEVARGESPPLRFHSSASCFLETLKQYWETNSRALELRETWHATTQDSDSGGAAHGVPSQAATMPTGSQTRRIELKPAVIFGKTRWALSFGLHNNRRTHEQSSGLVFTLRDIHYPRSARHPFMWLSSYKRRVRYRDRMMIDDW